MSIKRSMRKPRFPFQQKGLLGDLNLIHRSMLAPGETVKTIETRARLQSLPTPHSLTGATVDVWYFAVPLRLLWEDFPEYVMDNDDETYVFPHQPEADYRLYQPTNTAPFAALAYEMVVNKYFRDEHDAPYVYSSTGDMAVLPIVDQTYETMGSVDYDDIDQTVDVSGGTLSLADLAKARENLKLARKKDRMSGRYEDYLRSQGVRVDARTAEGSAEMFGHYRKFVWPQKSINPTTGLTAQSYSHDFHMKLTAPRYVNEHSILIGVCSVRPKVLPYGGTILETEWTNPKSIPSVGQPHEHKRLNNVWAGSTEADEVYRTSDDVLWRGMALSRALPNTAMVSSFNPSTMEEIRFPSSTWRGFVADKARLSGDDYVIDGVANVGIATPLKRTRA